MHRTTLAILWHMHQPYYRDMATGLSSMPWVRLHAIHSYYDMLRLYERFPNVEGTINFVPTLVEQLLAYAEGASDVFLDHTLVPARELSHQQRAFILRHFFMVNPERKIAPHPAYQKLFARRGLDPARIDFEQAIRFFSAQDYLDIQVFYNLVWFGFAAREESPELARLLAKGGRFTEEEKGFVVGEQRRVMRELLDALRRAAHSENVEISTTPYHHPILPLLIDTSFAHRSNPKAALPPAMRLLNIAKAEIEGALSSMERWTGRRPVGIWPAEGGVCPEMIPMLADAGAKWMASDDRVLMNSLPPDRKGVSFHQPFIAEHEGRKIAVVFRDHSLSDLLSFTYSKMPAAAAVSDFLGHATKVDGGGGDKLLTVILDGENPWEFYPESGREFLTTLFTKIGEEGVPTETISGYLAKNPPAVTIPALHTGSWIDANFNIWIGKPQKNAAWGYIKRAMDELGDSLSGGRREADPAARRAFESLSAACGSDWFWWYDDDFDSAFKPDFDRIFRQHLKNAFRLQGRDVPLFLFEPIYRFEESASVLAEPPGFISPTIDGRRSSFFEWANSVRMNVHGRGGAMALSSEPFETISFGFNAEAFFLRIDPVDAKAGFTLHGDETLALYIHDGSEDHKLSLRNAEGSGFMLEAGAAGAAGEKPAGRLLEAVRWSADRVFEIAMPFSALGFKVGELITVAIALNRRGIEARRYSHIRFTVPDETYGQRMWGC